MQEEEQKFLECVICEKKIQRGRLCHVCSREVDEKKTEILSEHHPSLILTEKRTH